MKSLTLDAHLRVHIVPCLRDNYAYLVESLDSGALVLVDAPEAAPILAALDALPDGLARLGALWSTHHHHDHVGANLAIAAAWADLHEPPLPILPIGGHASDRGRIPGQTTYLEDRDAWKIDHLEIQAIHVPGHTLGAVAYLVTSPASRALFTGDTLFLGGCGRLFEGTAEQMASSLSRLTSVPDDTLVFCGHEYTAANLRFALTLEPDHAPIRARLGALTLPTVPAPMGLERETNPFLRLHSQSLRAHLALPEAPDAEVFAAVRRLKDAFRG
jgi:hydroxyacylglutathione hydrolase